MTRALVVDDSQFMRTVVGNALKEQGYEVVEASNGQQALKKVEEHEPDVITMDVAMPEMDGIEATDRIMERWPTPILMVSAHTEKGAEATLDALERGAVDFLAKPGGEASIEAGSIKDDLVEKVDAITEVDVNAIEPLPRVNQAEIDASEAGDGETMSVSASTSEPDTDVAVEPHTPSVGEISSVIEEKLAREYVRNPTIVVGASTGGPKLVSSILRDLPRALDARVLIVQHMPESFTGRFAERLDAVSAYSVAEAEDGERISGGEVRIAKGDSHLEVTNYSSGRLRLRLADDKPIHGVKPSIDVTMTSAAQTIDDPLVGVALTGMGKDGAEGIREIKEAGGNTFAQNEETSPVFGIPQQAIKTGCVDEVLAAGRLVEGILDVLSERGDNDG